MRLTNGYREDAIARVITLLDRMWQTYSPDVPRTNIVYRAVEAELREIIDAEMRLVQLIRPLYDDDRANNLNMPGRNIVAPGDHVVHVIVPDPPGAQPYDMAVRVIRPSMIRKAVLSPENRYLEGVMQHVNERNRIAELVFAAEFVCREILWECNTTGQVRSVSPTLASILKMEAGGSPLSDEMCTPLRAKWESIEETIATCMMLPELPDGEKYTYTLS